MEELVAWLRGVLDDIEAAAKAATPGPWGAQPGGQGTFDNEWEVVSDAHEPPEPGHYVVYTGYEGGGASSEQNALHIARHDPRQVLEDVRMKRDLLDEYEAVAHLDTEGPELGYAHGRTVGLGEAVKTIAAAYRHRPGWRDSWGA